MNSLSFWQVVAALAPMGIALIVYWCIKGRETLDHVDRLFPRSGDQAHQQDSTDKDRHSDEDGDADEHSEIA